MLYQKEFPEFKPDDMPAIPQGFEDVSWHNDSMPSFFNESLRLVIWVDFANPEEREFPEMERFSLHATDETGYSSSEDKTLIVTDDWNALLHKIADIESEMKRQAPPLTECAEERAEQEGTDPIDERNADQDAAARAKEEVGL